MFSDGNDFKFVCIMTKFLGMLTTGFLSIQIDAIHAYHH